MPTRLMLMMLALLCLATLAGCPVNDGATDGLVPTDDGTPADNNADNGTPSDGADAAPGDDSGADGAGDGSADDGAGGTPDDGAGSDGGGSDSSPPDESPPSGGGAEPIVGTFSGLLDCTVSDSAFGVPGTPTQETMRIWIRFDENGAPTGFVVPGYSAVVARYQFDAPVVEVGDSVEMSHTDGQYSATLTITVAEATYDATGGRVVLDLVHHGQEGERREDGTGSQVVEYELAGQSLSYASRTDYAVTWTFPNISAETTLTFDCQGVLAPQ